MNIMNVMNVWKSATFMACPTERKARLNVMNVVRKCFALSRTRIAKLAIASARLPEGLRQSPQRSFWGYPRAAREHPRKFRGYPQKFSGLSFGISPQDVGIARGSRPPSPQDVGITLFLTFFLSDDTAAGATPLAVVVQRSPF